MALSQRGSFLALVLVGTLVQHAVYARTPTPSEIIARRELVIALYQWLDATNAGDLGAQSTFYPHTMEAFYLWRRVPHSAVLEEKQRVFASARVIDIRADAPQIIVDAGAKTARMYFRKTYVIEGRRVNRRGEVLQELRWMKHADGWKIISERDIKVIP